MKVFRLFVGALLAIMVTHVYAVTPVMPAPQAAASTDEQDALKLFAVLSGCELEDQCVVGMLNQLVKSDPNPAFKEYLKQLAQKKDILDLNLTTCATQQTKAYKKVASDCMTEALTVNGKLALPKNVNEKMVQSCMFKKLEDIAKNGNIYAQVALAENALKQNDVNNHTYWINMAKGQGRNPESAVFEQCAPGLGLTLSVFIETVKSLDRNHNVTGHKR
ncbi:MAG: hypothetical protein AB7I18_04150 [Candidatus Berkiella sp.]